MPGFLLNPMIMQPAQEQGWELPQQACVGAGMRMERAFGGGPDHHRVG